MDIGDMDSASNKDGVKVSSRLKHFSEAFRLYRELVSKTDALRSHREANPGLYVPVGKITVAEANKLAPAEDYLCLYCDLLGFSNDMTESGSDSLPDFYGAALATAAQHPSVNVYLFSDTCVAFAPSSEGSSFLNFVSVIFSRWLSDAMVPQAFVGYGSFVERKPDLGCASGTSPCCPGQPCACTSGIGLCPGTAPGPGLDTRCLRAPAAHESVH